MNGNALRGCIFKLLVYCATVAVEGGHSWDNLMAELVVVGLGPDVEEEAKGRGGAVVNRYLQKISMLSWTSIIRKQCKSTEVIPFLPQLFRSCMSFFARGNDIFPKCFFLLKMLTLE